MSYGRMQEDEIAGRGEAAVAGGGEGRRGRGCPYRTGEELPAELGQRETRLKKIQEAQLVLEERAKSKGQPEEKAKAKAQYNFTDPESRIMKGPDGFVQAYNAQIAVEPDFQLIVGQVVSQAPNDKEQMKPVMTAIQEQSGQKPKEVVSDSGYCSDANLKYLGKKKVEGFVAVDRESYRDRKKPCVRGPLPKGATRVDRMRRKL
jgi:Transposase DDE domain